MNEGLNFIEYTAGLNGLEELKPFLSYVRGKLGPLPLSLV